MPLPYVINNRAHTLADVLDDLLHSDAVRALDVATAYLNVGAFDLVQDGLEQLASFRLLLGSKPGAGDLGLPQSLRREQVAVRLYERGFLHAKAYLCFADRPPGDRFTPVAGIVGSSNFTRASLTTNQELNLTHKSVAEDSAIDEAEADDIEAQAAVEPLLDDKVTGTSEVPVTSRRAIKSEVGARAILELLDWYDERWAQAILENLPALDRKQYDLERLREAVEHDVEILTEIWKRCWRRCRNWRPRRSRSARYPRRSSS